MTPRRRAQESGRRARAEQRRAGAVVARGARRWTEADESDAVWAEHQEWERARRAVPLVQVPAVRQPRRPPLDIRAVIAAVEADFARWRQGDFS